MYAKNLALTLDKISKFACQYKSSIINEKIISNLSRKEFRKVYNAVVYSKAQEIKLHFGLEADTSKLHNNETITEDEYYFSRIGYDNFEFEKLQLNFFKKSLSKIKKALNQDVLLRILNDLIEIERNKLGLPYSENYIDLNYIRENPYQYMSSLIGDRLIRHLNLSGYREKCWDLIFSRIQETKLDLDLPTATDKLHNDYFLIGEEEEKKVFFNKLLIKGKEKIKNTGNTKIINEQNKYGFMQMENEFAQRGNFVTYIDANIFDEPYSYSVLDFRKNKENDDFILKVFKEHDSLYSNFVAKEYDPKPYHVFFKELQAIKCFILDITSIYYGQAVYMPKDYYLDTQKPASIAFEYFSFTPKEIKQTRKRLLDFEKECNLDVLLLLCNDLLELNRKK